jgi:DNA-binding transcriptional regulator YdaS (Cro superfamily)
MDASIHPLDHAAFLLGGRAALAEKLKVTAAAVGNWKVRGVPIEHCPAIESLTGARVCRRQLRPADWAAIWPELATPTDTQTASQPTTQEA